MGFPWKKLAGIGKLIARFTVPQIEAGIELAEEKFGGQKGAGPEKAAWLDAEVIGASVLPLIEKLTGKNVDSPATRALLAEVRDTYVVVKNTEAAARAAFEEYERVQQKLEAALAEIHAPAK